MALLPEQLARAEADAGYVGLESLLDVLELRPEPHRADAALMHCAAQLRFALRLKGQAVCRYLVALGTSRADVRGGERLN